MSHKNEGYRGDGMPAARSMASRETIYLAFMTRTETSLPGQSVACML